jgi:hypothetical protein
MPSVDRCAVSGAQLGQEALHRQQGVDVVIGLKSKVGSRQRCLLPLALLARCTARKWLRMAVKFL